jgi:UDP-glucose 4-epimerase
MARAPLEDPAALLHFAPIRRAAEPVRPVEVAPAEPTPAPDRHPRGGARPGERILITGIAGGQGRLITRRLAKDFEIAGVDRQPWDGHPRGVRVHVLDLRKRKFEDIFRTERPDAVVHHAFVRHFRGDPEVRHEVNVLGTKRLLEYAIAHGVKRIVVLSSGYVYGALPDNPYYVDEEYPLNVSRTYPEVRDLAEVDTLVGAFLWRHPEVATTILRPVNTLGYYVHSAIGKYLRQRYVPTIMGFNPMMQFIHEEDVAEAVALALQSGTHGVFNVVGPGAVPLKVAIRETGGAAVPIPESIARVVFTRLFRLGLYHTPVGAMDFLKYPCTLDGGRFEAATGFRPLFSLEDVFASVRR